MRQMTTSQLARGAHFDCEVHCMAQAIRPGLQAHLWGAVGPLTTTTSAEYFVGSAKMPAAVSPSSAIAEPIHSTKDCTPAK